MAPEAAARTVLDDLAHRRLVVVSGKGGVGRTTVAALLGLALAQRGRRVLVATTGSDARLAWMLGHDELESVPRRAGAGLWIQRLDPQRCIREYGALVGGSETLAHLVFDSAILRRLLRAIPGLDDFTVLGKVWHEAVRGGSFDTVVFDGPASGHLRYVLGVPRTILSTVLAGPLHREARAIQDTLADASIAVGVLVTRAEPWPLTETGELAAALRAEAGLEIAFTVVNGVWSRKEATLPDAVPAGIREALRRGSARGRVQWEALRAAPHDATPRLVLPWHLGGIDGPAAIDDLLSQLERAVVPQSDGAEISASS
jgi:hypothetical protein